MENTLIDSRYMLLAPLGSGGEARVFRARDAVTQDEVALRLSLQPEKSDAPAHTPPTDFHPGWVRLLASGSDAQHGFYQVFELLEGRTLRAWVQARPLDATEWRTFVDQSLGALKALHNAGWVHGDLNADNFFHVTTGWKLLELPFTRPTPPPGRTTLFGSIHTLSPEQFDGKSPDIRSDLYSLGCLYYYSASGGYPHPGATSQEVAIHCICHAPASLREKAPQLPANWSDWVMKLIAPKPADRFSSVATARQLLGVA